MRSTITAALMLLSCAAVPQATGAQPATTAVSPTAYLDSADLPDPRSYLAPPPAPGSAAFLADRAAYESALKSRNGPAWKQAVEQLRVRSPAVAAQMMCVLGVRVDTSPGTAFGRVLQRSALTLSQASEQAKAVWNRDRPYIGDRNAVICDPEANFGAQNPSYPSGHAGIGWMWGLMLSQLAPERASQALAWGTAIGENRIACRVHYPSDIAAGRSMGAALYARLQAEPAFRADMDAARTEIAAARGAGAKPECPN